MEIKRILWPTDLSDVASQALPYVTSLAEKYNAKVIVLHVMEEVTRFERLANSLNYSEAQNMREHLWGESTRSLESLCEILEDKCPLFQRQVVEGDPGEQILDYIEKQEIDLVIMATHGRTGISRFNYGSVADRVVHHAPIPVLTVRAK